MLAYLPRKSVTPNNNGTILVVEDDPQNLDLIASYLNEAGYTVDCAEDGEVALKKLKSNTDYSLVITDRKMPKADGMTVLSYIKNTPHLEHLSVIMQTGVGSPSELAEGIVAGVYYYLTKPYLEETLMTLVKSAMHAKHQRDFFIERNFKQRQALGTFCYGKFELKTIEEAQNVSLLLGGLFPKPDIATLGLYELILNAVEHGNLGIGFEAKGKLIAASEWQKEVEKRLALPENKNKTVSVIYTNTENKINITITDEGAGFDWRPYLQIEPSRATQGNGRGIAKANLLCFDSVTYQGNGNTVQVTKKITE